MGDQPDHDARQPARRALEDAFYGAPAAIFVKDHRGRYLFVNQAYRSLFDIPDDRDVAGATDADLVDLGLADKLTKADQVVLSTTEDNRSEILWHTQEGSTRLLSRQSTSIQPASTGFDHAIIIGTTRDETELDATSRSLFQKASALRERVKELSCLYDISRMLLDAHPGLSDHVLESVACRLPDGWKHPELATARVTVGECFGSTPAFRSTAWTQTHSFEAGDVDGTIEIAYTADPRASADQPVFLTEEQRLIESLGDRLREASLREQAVRQIRFQAALLDAVGDSVIATDLDGHVIYWNRAAEDLYGWTSDEALGRDILEMTPSQESEALSTDIMGSLADGNNWSGEAQLRRKSGQTFVAHVTNTAIRDDDGDIVGFVGVSRNVTRIKTLESELAQAKKLEAIGRLAGGIAHDFNNMLTAIQGNALLLGEDVSDPLQLESIEEIQHAATRAEDLTSQLLAFSRRQVLNPRVISLATTVEGTQKMLDRLIGENIIMTFSIAEDVDPIVADPGQISQIVMNLVVNARDAVEEAGHISVTVRPLTIEEAIEETSGAAGTDTSAPPGQYAVLEVSDDGAGMDAGVAESIFDPFFTTKPEGRGTGLGLATVFGIVKQSGGYIDVDSRPGFGSTFSVYLPTVEGELTPVEPTPTPQPPVTRSTQTLIVCEDQRSVRRITHRVLSAQGYTVLTASSGPEALDLLDEYGPDIDMVVTDVVMPEMSGYELARIARREHPDVTFLFISGYPKTRGGMLDQDFELSAEEFLKKPFSPTDLLHRVAQLLGESNAD